MHGGGGGGGAYAYHESCTFFQIKHFFAQFYRAVSQFLRRLALLGWGWLQHEYHQTDCLSTKPLINRNISCALPT